MCVLILSAGLPGLMGFLLYDLNRNWDSFSNCNMPIQNFLLLAYCFLLGLSIIPLSAMIPIIQILGKCLGFILVIVGGPLSMYLTIQGSVWESQNEKYSPNCIPGYMTQWGVWVIIGVLSFYNVAYLVLLGYIGYKLRKKWILRNHVNHQQENLIEEDRSGLSYNQIQQIPGKTYSQNLDTLLGFQNTDCSICCEQYQVGDSVTPFPTCEHLFHARCINPWLLKSSLCPLCRFNLRRTFNVEAVSLQVS